MTTAIPTDNSVLDLAEAMQNMDGDAELLQEIVEIFMETSGVQIESLEQCIAGGDFAQVAIQAHAMKGGASNFCAGAFVAAALRLETLAKSGTLDGASDLLDAMKAKLAEVAEVVPNINWDEVARSWQG